MIDTCLDHISGVSLDKFDRLLKRIGSMVVSCDPFPHIFIQDAFDTEFISCLRAASESCNTNASHSGVLVTDLDSINDNQTVSEFLLFENILLIPLIISKFKMHMKYAEEYILKEEGKEFKVADEHTYMFNQFATAPKSYSSPFHIDSCWASIQLIFYLGDESGGEINTTQLLRSSTSTEIDICQYDKSNNGLLAFVNSAQSFHGLIQAQHCQRKIILSGIRIYEN